MIKNGTTRFVAVDEFFIAFHLPHDFADTVFRRGFGERHSARTPANGREQTLLYGPVRYFDNQVLVPVECFAQIV